MVAALDGKTPQGTVGTAKADFVINGTSDTVTKDLKAVNDIPEELKDYVSDLSFKFFPCFACISIALIAPPIARICL